VLESTSLTNWKMEKHCHESKINEKQDSLEYWFCLLIAALPCVALAAVDPAISHDIAHDRSPSKRVFERHVELYS